MSVPRGIAGLRNLREQPLWRLLAADKAAIFIALLQELLFDQEKVLPASVLAERLSALLEGLQTAGEDVPQTAQAYLALWLSEGWVHRRLPTGATEEQYELSNDAAQAIRFLSTLLKRRAVMTESRLATVIHQLIRLAEETDRNPQTRLGALMAERDRIDKEIATVRVHGVQPLDDERAIERAREIIALADELTGDFRRVRDDFDQLNRGLRQLLLENDGSRGDVLESLFAGVDLIGESDAGKTFAAFWRLLTDPEQAEALGEAITAVGDRPFARKLHARERKFLLNLTAVLANEGSGVHDVLQHFARSLKSFVQSREFLEQRRLHSLLKMATQAALAAREHVRPFQEIGYELTLTSSRIRSISQAKLYDPAERVLDTAMTDAAPSEIDLSIVTDLIRHSEIDFRALKRNLRAVLEQQARASIAQVMDRFPPEQGLGSVVGYVALGVKHGEATPGVELVDWEGEDHAWRRAKIPTIYFTRERCHELVE